MSDSCYFIDSIPYIGGVFVVEMSSSLSRISSRSLGYSSNRSARPVTQIIRLIKANHPVNLRTVRQLSGVLISS